MRSGIGKRGKENSGRMNRRQECHSLYLLKESKDKLNVGISELECTTTMMMMMMTEQEAATTTTMTAKHRRHLMRTRRLSLPSLAAAAHIDDDDDQPRMGTLTWTETMMMRRRMRMGMMLLDREYLTEAAILLQSAHNWSFNMFTLNKLTSGRSLLHMTLHLFSRYELIREFQIDIVQLMQCITLIESSYDFANPYHNSVHAADVVQAMHCHLNEAKISQCMKPIEKMAAILSAACHDVYHPGTNQAFLIATSNPLCALYDNASVLENHHWRSTISILLESKVFDHLNHETWNTLRRLIKTMILATDITRQHEILSVFREHLDKNTLHLESNEKHRNLILQITLKCADISNPCRPWKLSKRWSELICKEFFKQGDSEQTLGIPVTPFCDSMNSTVAKIQTGFMTYVAEPLFIEWNRYSSTTTSQMMLENLRYNRNNWEKLASTKEESNEIQTTMKEKDFSKSFEHFDQFTSILKTTTNPEKENVDPFPSSSDVVVCERRRSLPSDDLNVQESNTMRRFSLPTDPSCNINHTFSMISHLTVLLEHNSQVTTELCDFSSCRKKSNVKESRRDQQRRDLAQNNRQASRMNDRNTNVKVNFFDAAAVVNRKAEKRNGLEDKKSKSSSPLHVNHIDRCRLHATRKLSVPGDILQNVLVGRKRSSSLVTSMLVCDEKSGHFKHDGLQVAASESVQMVAGFQRLKNRGTKNHFVTSKKSKSIPHSVLSEDDRAGRTAFDTTINCSCPNNKSVTTRRTATSVFSSSVEDPEAVPLLNNISDSHICNKDL